MNNGYSDELSQSPSMKLRGLSEEVEILAKDNVPLHFPTLVLSYISTYTRQILLNADLCHNNYLGKNSQHGWLSSRRKTEK